MAPLAKIALFNGKPQSFWDILNNEIGGVRPVNTPQPTGTPDPTGLGYLTQCPPSLGGTADERHDDRVAAILNFIPDGSALYPYGTGVVKPAIPIADGVISALEWVTALAGAEVAAFTAGQAAFLDAITQYVIRYGSFTYSGRLKTQIETIFTTTGVGSTRSNLNLRASRNGSRAEQILIAVDRQWLGYEVTIDDVSFVLNGQDKG
jgi:hypothetical protein